VEVKDSSMFNSSSYEESKDNPGTLKDNQVSRTALDAQLEDDTTIGFGLVVGTTIVLELVNVATLAMKLIYGMALNRTAAVELQLQ